MTDKFITAILVTFFVLSLVGLLIIMNENEKDRCNSTNADHTFLVYYTSIPDTLCLSGSYKLTSHRGTNEIYQIECDKISPKCILSTTAPIKHIFDK